MQLTIIKNNRLDVLALPENINGSYWITDFLDGKKINLMNVEPSQEGWVVCSDRNASILNEKGEIIPKTTLKNYTFYLFKNNIKNEKCYIYCSPIYDDSYKELNIKETITIGSDIGNIICYSLNGVPKRTFILEKSENNKYVLKQLENNIAIYVNQKKITEETIIEYGDIIFLFGLKIILMKNDDSDYLLINNPNNLVKLNASFKEVEKVKDTFVSDNAELDNELSEKNYFYRSPHFYRTLQNYELVIDAPPQKKEEDKTPAILTIGPMLTFAMMSISMLASTFISISTGRSDFKSSIVSIIMGVAMLASCLLWPLAMKAYQKYSNKKYEEKRKEMYSNYLAANERKVQKELSVQTVSLKDNSFTIAQCQEIIKNKNVKLWQKRITDDDFLSIPVGNGNMPMKLEIKYPEERFTLEKDSLLDLAHNLGKQERVLYDVPITFSFYQNTITGIVGDKKLTKEFIDRIILQMMCSYSYDELKLVLFTSTENALGYDYFKILPHAWSNDHSIRFFGTSNDDYREIIYYLDNIYNERKNKKENIKHTPHYVIITDSIKAIDNYDFIKNIMEAKDSVGFSIIMMVEKVATLPNECKNFINVNRQDSAIFNSAINDVSQTFKIDFTKINDLYSCALELANIPIDIKSDIESSLPDTYHFLEMYQVGKVEQLNSFERWKNSNPIISLQAPVGIGKSGEIINLDLHEKYHGPHGLIAGTTGSGKSEFIITYILSLAINYHPYEAQIILIDYKGGSLAGAFANDDYRLPHLAGTITNLDGNELNRSLASIESEIKEDKEFNEAKSLSAESTMDIYKYQEIMEEGALKDKEPIAHLFIISDEFAELKEQQPEFMEKLISAARVGRSLGIHLILATQKPGGVVDPQIWSNTRFRVCLKVQDTSDSQEVLKRADAAYLKKTGRFYLQVGYNEVYTLGQSAWAGGQYYPNTIFKKSVDTSVNAINDIGYVTLSKDVEKIEVESLGEELPNIVKYLNDLAKKSNIKIKKLWLDKMPSKVYVDSLKKKYKYNRIPYIINPIVGEYDDPENQNQYPLTIPLTKLGNAIVYGIAGSEENFLKTLIYSSITTYTPMEIQLYILDFGAETLRIFSESPQVGDIAYINDEDRVKNLFKMLNEEVVRRKNLFVNYGGTYRSYIENKNDIYSIVVIINGYEAFLENYEDVNEELIQLSREAYKYGIHFLLTVSNDNSVRIKVKQNFNLIYALAQNNDLDFSNILGNIKGKNPAKYLGRGLFKKDSIYEFQTAFIDSDSQDTTKIKEVCAALKDNFSVKAKKIPVLPECVDYSYIANEIEESSNIIVGVNKEKLDVEKYNFQKNGLNLVSSYEIENTTMFIKAIAKQVVYAKYFELVFVNATDETIMTDSLLQQVYTNQFDEIVCSISKYVDAVYDIFEQNKFNNEILKEHKKMFVIIFGLYDFINKLSDDTKKGLSNIIKKNNSMNLVSFVLVDSPDVIKGFVYEDWFKQGADLSRGIWIGSGIAEQSLFRISKITREDREDITNNYGYIINSSKLTSIKLLEKFES